jgi:hypothetical protein
MPSQPNALSYPHPSGQAHNSLIRTSVPQRFGFFLPQALLPFLPTHNEESNAAEYKATVD